MQVVFSVTHKMRHIEPKEDLTGRVFGRLVVIALIRNRRWLVRCECETEFQIVTSRLVSGHVKSCGCLSRDLFLEVAKCPSRSTHGKSYSPTYTTWKMMLQRTMNPKDPSWHKYGGRGIKVCERWLTFENFLADMCERPEGTTIEREDNNGNYEPDNCKWATSKEQANNTRQNVVIEFQGQRKTLAQWVETTGLSRKALDWRLNAGWGVERMLTTPVARRSA